MNGNLGYAFSILIEVFLLIFRLLPGRHQFKIS